MKFKILNLSNLFILLAIPVGWYITRPFFSYLDESGKASKPFVLPQENPDFYNTFIKNYNIPELITGEVVVSPQALRDKVLENTIQAKIDLSVDTIYMKVHLSVPKK